VTDNSRSGSALTETEGLFSADDDTGSPCGEMHDAVDGLCARCGVWVPEGICLSPRCDWRSGATPRTLVRAVEHWISTGHSVRVRVN
jgi:hypothetical protein